ncbi:uncharacterized protein LOC144937666 [Lampetra fluviatilis]
MCPSHRSPFSFVSGHAAFTGISPSNLFAVLNAAESFPSYDGAMAHAYDYNALGMSYTPSPGQTPLGWPSLLRRSGAAAVWDLYMQQCARDVALAGQLSGAMPATCNNGAHGGAHEALVGSSGEFAGGRDQWEAARGQDRPWENQRHDRDNRADSCCQQLHSCSRRQEGGGGDEVTAAGHRRHRNHRLRHREELAGSEEHSLC